MNLKRFVSNHRPVLLSETLGLLEAKAGETYLDATAGGGGHARAIAQTIGMPALTLVDADPDAVARLAGEFARATLYNNSFVEQMKELESQDRRFDMILADLGLSSFQLEDPDRGFSFRRSAPLDMRFDPRRGLSLAQQLETIDVDSLADILKRYGQERDAWAIARAIKAQQPATTTALAEIAVSVKGRRAAKRHLHPATQTFMAFRIWINQELEQLEGLLAIAPKLLQSGGRLAVISFHSLEDRLVKRAFRELSDGGYESSYRLITKKPIVPTDPLATHPQARSAKLRALKRL